MTSERHKEQSFNKITGKYSFGLCYINIIEHSNTYGWISDTYKFEGNSFVRMLMIKRHFKNE